MKSSEGEKDNGFVDDFVDDDGDEEEDEEAGIEHTPSAVHTIPLIAALSYSPSIVAAADNGGGTAMLRGSSFNNSTSCSVSL